MLTRTLEFRFHSTLIQWPSPLGNLAMVLLCEGKMAVLSRSQSKCLIVVTPRSGASMPVLAVLWTRASLSLSFSLFLSISLSLSLSLSLFQSV